MNEYISVSEFAKMAGVSRQAIQQRLTTSLAEFVKADSKGIKLLNIKGLELFGVSIDKTTDKPKSKVEQGTEQDEKDILYQALSQTIESLNKTVENLNNQIGVKDKQIESLTQLLNQQQQLQAQQQKLLDDKTADQEQDREEKTTKKGIFKKLFSRTRF